MVDTNDSRKCDISGCSLKLTAQRYDITLLFGDLAKKVETFLCDRHWSDLKYGDSATVPWFAELAARAK